MRPIEKTKKPLFTKPVLAFLGAVAAGALYLLGGLVPVVKPLTDAAAPVVQEAIEHAPAKDEAPASGAVQGGPAEE